MSRKISRGFGIFAIAALASTLGVAIYGKFSVGYLTWKLGRAPAQWKKYAGDFNTDADFKKALLGKSPQEMTRWFPAEVLSRSASASQRKYQQEAMNLEPNEKAVWLDNTNVILIFKANAFVRALAGFKG